MQDHHLHSRVAGGKPGHSCQTCEYWSGEITPAGCAVCWHHYPQQTVTPFPERGCVFWLRAIGSDDEEAASKNGASWGDIADAFADDAP